MKSIAEIDALAASAHAGQIDKIGVPYIEHVRAVAAGLASFGSELQMAGLLHDIIEDTDLTGDQLRSLEIGDHVVDIVEQVTNISGVTYMEKIHRIAANRDAALLKISDNAHNSRSDRTMHLSDDKRASLAKRYRRARAVLFGAVSTAEAEAILSAVNPELLGELYGRTGG